MRFIIFFLFGLGLSACGSVTPLTEKTVSDTQEPDKIFEEDIQTTSSATKEPEISVTETIAPVVRKHGLIEELAKNFTWNRHLEQPEVNERIQWHSKNQEQLQLLLNRSATYLPLIADEVRSRGLPEELVFLPLIESGFRPDIHSHSGAAGLWQLMPSTARHLGLQIDWWYDGRMNIQSSTIKALDYLEYLNKQFDGDWELAITAYNGGEGHVRARMRRVGSENFWDLPLKTETEQFLPRLLAAAEILANPDQYGVQIPHISPNSNLKALKIDQQIDLRLAAERAGMDYQQLKILNADFLRWITPPKGSYELTLPEQYHRALQDQIAHLQPDQSNSWDHYRVQSGDTLIDIAREFSTTVRAIIAVNELPNSRIYARQELLIPRVEAPSIKSQPGTMKELYIVKSGDSLWRIANRNDLSISRLKSLNALDDTTVLQPGQVLILNEYFEGSETDYEVQRGDSLSVIANRFKVAVTDIMLWNSLNQRDLIHPGQILKIREI